jgi:hypothetical protein
MTIFWQFVSHIVGDFCLQSDWMAVNKQSRMWPCVAHAITYTLTFMIFMWVFKHGISFPALGVIGSTHLLIDHYKLPRFIIYPKNFLAPVSAWPKWTDCDETGFNKSRPIWLTLWLFIIVDNTSHLVINYLALKYL